MNDLDLLIEELKQPRYYDASGNLRPFDWVVERITRPSKIPNPDPPRKVPAPVDKREVMSLVPPESIRAADYEALLAFGRAADANDHETLQLQLQVWLMKGWLTPDVASRLQPILNRQVDDPNWPAEVNGPSRLERVLGKKSVPHKLLREAYDAVSR